MGGVSRDFVGGVRLGARKEGYKAGTLSAETEAKLTACLDGARDAMALIDPEGRVLYANAALARLAEREGEALGGAAFGRLFARWAELPLGLALRRAAAGEEPTLAGPHRTAEGRWLALEASRSEGAVLLTLRDVSDGRGGDETRGGADERSQFALTSAGMGTWEWTLAGNEVRWSESMERLHGHAPGSFDGTFDFFLNDVDLGWREHVMEALRVCIDEGRDLHMQYLLRRPDGSTAWIDARARLLLDEHGAAQRMIGVCVDSSERKQIEEALRDSEEAHRFLSESIPTQVWTALPSGQLDHVNRQVREYFDRSSEEVLGLGWQGFIHPEDLDECVTRWTQSLTTGTPYEVEFRLRRADGEYRWYIGRALAMRDRDGAIVKWFGTNTDIHEQKRIGQTQRFIIGASSLLAASLDYETTLASVARLAVPEVADWCAVDLLDPEDGGLRRVTVAHIDPEKVALAHQLQRKYPIDMQAQTGVPQVLRSGKAELNPVIEDWMLVQGCRDAEELRMARALGLTSSMVVPLTARGRTLGAISLVAAESGRHFTQDDLRVANTLALRCAVAIDNSVLLKQAQEAEQELRRLNEDLERRVAERTADVKRGKDRVEEANARLKELDTMKDEFLGALSYQLASPINAVIGYTDLLVEGAGGSLREEQRRYVRRITASSKVLLSLVHDLLDMSRMSAGKFELDREQVELGALAREVLESLEPLTEMQGLRVVCRIADGLAEVSADAQRMEQVVINMLHNAIQLTSSGGLMRLSVEQTSTQVRLEIHHTGTSLEAKDLDRIFHRYTRLGGAWLGLSIARRVVEGHGGAMGVEPNASAGGGNTFWCTLPLPT